LRATSPLTYALSVLLALLAVTIMADAAAAVPTAADDQKACDGKDADACFRVGERAAIAKDAVAAERAYRRACDGDVGLACYHVGQNYEADPKKKADLLARSAAIFARRCAARDGKSCFSSGISLERGVGVKKDLGKALAAYAKSCELGHLAGCTNLAGMHLTGKGTKKDTVKAAAVYTGACRDGDVWACYWLGRIHSGEIDFAGDKSHITTIEGKSVGMTMGVERKGIRASNLKRGPVIEALVKSAAADALQKSCDGGKGLDCYLLGVVRLMGGGSVPKDDVKAAALFRKACEAGNGWGCMNLADMTMRGYGVQQSFGDAAGWYRKICDRAGGDTGFDDECHEIIDRMGL